MSIQRDVVFFILLYAERRHFDHCFYYAEGRFMYEVT